MCPCFGLSLLLPPYPETRRTKLFLVRGEEFCFLMCPWLSKLEENSWEWHRLEANQRSACLFQPGVTASNRAASLCAVSGPMWSLVPPTVKPEARPKPSASKSFPLGLLLQSLPTIIVSISVKAESQIQRTNVGELAPWPAQL